MLLVHTALARRVILILLFVLLLTGCNFVDDDAPPTLAPRMTQSPLPTIGYATLDSSEISSVGTVATVQPTFNAEFYRLISQVESARLMNHVATFQSFETRHVNSSYTTPGLGIGAAHDYIFNEFQSIEQLSGGTFTVTSHSFSLTWGGVRSIPKNIIGILNGTEPGAGVIVVGAHYDSRGGDLDDGTGYAPGANDNGSGVAALIEMARIMSASQHIHRSSVVFVAFSAEEQGRLGSIAFVRDYLQTYDIPVIAVLNLDIIGSSTNTDGSVNDSQIRLFSEGPDGSPSRQLARAINFIAFNYNADLEIVIQEADDRVGSYGDHISFSQLGYAAVRFTEMNEEPQRRHTDRDTIDDMQASYLVRATRTILTVLVALTDGPRPPRNITLRDNGDGTKRLVWESSLYAASYIVTLHSPNFLYYQQFETTGNFVDWDGFDPKRYISFAIASKENSGFMGPPSPEYLILP